MGRLEDALAGAAKLLDSQRVDWTQIALWRDQAETLFGNAWVRAGILLLLVYGTIRVIAAVYSGEQQNSALGPIAIRPHQQKKLTRDVVVLPRTLMPMNMDGVMAQLKVYYAYNDARGRRRKRLVYQQKKAKLAVSPTKLSPVAATIYGYEVPDVATVDVCFPPFDIETPEGDVPATAERAPAYAQQYRIVENWKEDDEAVLISLHADEVELTAEARREFLVDAAGAVAAARNASWASRLFNGHVARNRPNVVGSYYLKFEFSRDPLFVLTRHPDRDLKMTAWLTVLTSLFSLLMDAWPQGRAGGGPGEEMRPRATISRPPSP